jgi:hypothetical protein
MLHSVSSLDLMTVAPLLIMPKEEEEAGKVTVAAIITSTLSSLTVETVGAPLGRTPEATTIAETRRATQVVSAD